MREHHASAGLARAGVVLGSSHALGFEPKDLLLTGCENLDKSVRVCDSGSKPVKMEIIYLPY